MYRKLSLSGLVCLSCSPLLVLVFLGASNLAAQAQGSKDEQALIQIERDWCAAALKQDQAALGRILADDYTSVGARGIASTKAEDVAGLKTNPPVTTCVDTEVKVRVYGDAAVVTGLATRSGT